MTRFRRTYLAALLLAGTLGCATAPPVGGRVWHEQRLAEVELAHQRGEITTEAYLSLKNQIDATRLAYQESLREESYYHQHYDPFGFPFHGLHGFH